MMPTPRTLVAAAIAACALAACGHDDPLSPATLTGRRYSLERTGNDAIPIIWSAYQGDTTLLLGDTIIFGAPPHATRVITYHHAFRGEAPRTETFRVEMEFRTHDGEVEIGWFTPCPPNADCVANLIGPEIGGALLLIPNNGVPSPLSRYGLVRGG